MYTNKECDFDNENVRYDQKDMNFDESIPTKLNRIDKSTEMIANSRRVVKPKRIVNQKNNQIQKENAI